MNPITFEYLYVPRSRIAAARTWNFVVRESILKLMAAKKTHARFQVRHQQQMHEVGQNVQGVGLLVSAHQNLRSH
jgi:hypothetical protein